MLAGSKLRFPTWAVYNGRHIFGRSLLWWSIFRKLLSRMQASVIPCIIPRHHDILEVFVLNCQNVSCQVPCFSQMESCQSQNIPVPNRACGIAAKMLSCGGAFSTFAESGWFSLSEAAVSCRLSIVELRVACVTLCRTWG